VERREGRITGFAVRITTIQRELGMLKAALALLASYLRTDPETIMQVALNPTMRRADAKG
jgi:hypothetical protein